MKHEANSFIERLFVVLFLHILAQLNKPKSLFQEAMSWKAEPWEEPWSWSSSAKKESSWTSGSWPPLPPTATKSGSEPVFNLRPTLSYWTRKVHLIQSSQPNLFGAALGHHRLRQNKVQSTHLGESSSKLILDTSKPSRSSTSTSELQT